MKLPTRFHRLSLVLTFLWSASIVATAQTLPPTTINYQGRVSVAGAPVEGTGYFKFLLYAPDKRLWSNDDSHTGSEALAAYEPSGNVSVGVTGGLFSADLGSGAMPAITSSVLFDGSSNVRSEVYLRIWFSASSTGPFIKLTPDRRLASVPFALVAGTVAKGAITTDKLATDAVTHDKIQGGQITTEKLAIPGPGLNQFQLGTQFIAGGAVTADKIAPDAFNALSSTLVQSSPVPSMTAQEAIADHDAVAITKDAGNNVRLLKANSSVGSRSAFYGFAKGAAALGAPVTVHQFGALSGFTGLAAGSSYYLGITDGAITSIYPAANPIYVGYSLAADTLFVDPFGVTKKWANLNFWGSGIDGALSTTGDVSLASTLDGDVVVKQYTSLTINAGHTMTVANRCRGLVIYVDGSCTINGTLTMTARGANVDPTLANSIPATGIRLVRRKAGATETLLTGSDLGGLGAGGVGVDWLTYEALQPPINNDGKIYTIARSGGAGAPAQPATRSGPVSQGYAIGGTGGILDSGSGGGGAGGLVEALGSGHTGGAGAAGTCFSGGPGGGGFWGTGVSGGAGQPNGGAGGNGAGGGGAGVGGGGGAGNPHGTPNAVVSGTGGLLVLFVRGTLTVSGTISANGMAAGGVYVAGGGSSGGGRVIVLHAGSLIQPGSVQALGGVAGASTTDPGYESSGGPGGAGAVTIDQIAP